MRKMTYKHTLTAGYLGLVTQAAVNNLAPLLFVTFQKQFEVSISKLALIITVNFCIQILVEFIATKFVDIIGYRKTVVGAHIFCTIGMLGLGTLPFLFPSPYMGILMAVIFNSIGGGLIEVIVTPIVQALPGDHKDSTISLLHSFYSWGMAAIVILSTVYFNLAGLKRWNLLPLLWAILPFCNALLFSRVPIAPLIDKSEKPIPMRKLFSNKIFFVLLLMMLCAGAAEQAIAQWSSLFAEEGLGVSKTLGDLLGTCLFAVLMGLSRVLWGVKAGKFKLEYAFLFSSVLCILGYVLTAFSIYPVLSLLGCGICGFAVGIMWPGTFSLSAAYYPKGGTAMFALLALAGNLGCAAGPGLVGAVMNIGTLKSGISSATIFPLLLLMGTCWLKLRSSSAAADIDPNKSYNS